MRTLTPKHIHLLSVPAVFFQFHLEERLGRPMYKLGAISQERSKIEVKFLLSANIGSHIYATSIGTTTDDLE